MALEMIAWSSAGLRSLFPFAVTNSRVDEILTRLPSNPNLLIQLSSHLKLSMCRRIYRSLCVRSLPWSRALGRGKPCHAARPIERWDKHPQHVVTWLMWWLPHHHPRTAFEGPPIWLTLTDCGMCLCTVQCGLSLPVLDLQHVASQDIDHCESLLGQGLNAGICLTTEAVILPTMYYQATRRTASVRGISHASFWDPLAIDQWRRGMEHSVGIVYQRTH